MRVNAQLTIIGGATHCPSYPCAQEVALAQRLSIYRMTNCTLRRAPTQKSRSNIQLKLPTSHALCLLLSVFS